MAAGRISSSSPRFKMRVMVFQRDDFTCQRCGFRPLEEQIPKPYNGKYTLGPMCVLPAARMLVVDHVVPVVRGGENTVENFQTLCEPCNGHKSTKVAR